jgi:hypothetical protein
MLMWEEVSELPNEPALLVSVQWKRVMRIRIGAQAGKDAHIPQALVGSSAREITAGEPSEGKPVVWKFFRGHSSGGDNLKSDPAWRQERFKLKTAGNVLDTLNEKLGIYGVDIKWYVARLPKGEVVEAPPDEEDDDDIFSED